MEQGNPKGVESIFPWTSSSLSARGRRKEGEDIVIDQPLNIQPSFYPFFVKYFDNIYDDLMMNMIMYSCSVDPMLDYCLRQEFVLLFPNLKLNKAIQFTINQDFPNCTDSFTSCCRYHLLTTPSTSTGFQKNINAFNPKCAFKKVCCREHFHQSEKSNKTCRLCQKGKREENPLLI